ncbi:TIR domain-containing protein [Microbacterium sp. NPDC090007]|uniref:TIR domain-containing protein n=1 Tax=Microbacterium sp. NPDC090007 TaxID=3364204 RepID=UPI0038202C2C
MSYAQTSEAHSRWVRLLASGLHLLGYDVRVDQDVDDGNSLNGFMRSLTQARHVLLIVDENYVERADHVTASGVHTENALLQQVFGRHPEGWLAVIAVDNPTFALPAWLQELNPRAFNFNDSAFTGDALGSDQLDDPWRWLEGLPPDKTNAVPLKQQVVRAARLERITNLSDPGRSRTPALQGIATFPFEHELA